MSEHIESGMTDNMHAIPADLLVLLTKTVLLPRLLP